ncbi:MAG TPA: hypothetical protein VFZ53_21675 [Polyangiaceae bacterium]
MPDQIEAAPTGRAKCRGCGNAIGKGELRFGEALPNPFGEGDAMFWFHLACGACMRPEKFGPALETQPAPPPDAEWLKHAAEQGLAHHRLPRLKTVERAPSGRATCRSCREVIDKGAWRFALQMFEEGRFSPIGSIHVECAKAYFETKDVLDRVRKLTPALGDADAAEITRLLDIEKPGAPKAADEAAGAQEPDEK